MKIDVVVRDACNGFIIENKNTKELFVVAGNNEALSGYLSRELVKKIVDDKAPRHAMRLVIDVSEFKET